MQTITTSAYIISAVLFILSLKGLSRQESAKKGNIYGIIGMAIAIIATLYSLDFDKINNLNLLISSVIIASLIGLVLAIRIKMTSMPELIALLHSFIGLAAVLVGIVSYLEPIEYANHTADIIHKIEIVLGVFIGAVTFTGSLVAFGKLKEVLPSRALVLPFKHMINIMMLVGIIYSSYLFVGADSSLGLFWIAAVFVIACIFGLHLVASIGGADMPVVISMLNSYSGWAASATGFMLSNDLLIITGALVGSSGAILSYIMCKAMNRSFISVIMGGFGVKAGVSKTEEGEYTESSALEVANILSSSKKIIVTPGYGMATAHAQHIIHEIYKVLKEKDIEFIFAIHPVAGRMPGHMNVLLAEAKIPYDVVFEMDDVNDDFKTTDTVLVIGANDTVNPSALEDSSSPIAGMPVLRVWESENVIVLKRGMATGYAGVGNPLFYKENTKMLFGDAKKSLDEVMSHL